MADQVPQEDAELGLRGHGQVVGSGLKGLGCLGFRVSGQGFEVRIRLLKGLACRPSVLHVGRVILAVGSAPCSCRPWSAFSHVMQKSMHLTPNPEVSKQL